MSEGGIPSDLPKGWARARLGDIITRIEAGKSYKCEPRPASAGEWGIIKVSAMTWGKFDAAENKAVPDGVPFNPEYEIRAGDILLSRANTAAYVGASVIVHKSPARLLLSDKSLRIVPARGISRDWLAHLLSSPYIRSQISRRATGTKDSMRNISQSAIAEIECMVPPLGEQRRIVSALEEQLSRVDAAEKILYDSAHRIERYLQSSLRRMTLSYRSVRLGDVLADGLTNGRSVPTRTGGFPVLRLTALSGPYANLAQRKEGDWEATDAEPFLVKPGDFLISRGNGSVSLVGRGSLVSEVEDPVAYPDTMIRARLKREDIYPEYLRIIWSSMHVRQQIERQARTTAGIHKVNQKILGAVEFPLPDLLTQKEICARWSEIEEKGDLLSRTVVASKHRSTSLQRSLLSDAFTGRLVPQDPSDESADAVLARIRVERQAEGTPKGQRRRGSPAMREPKGPQAPDTPPPPVRTALTASITQTTFDQEIPS
ncbi:restriction endonuclease subunit S [Streptomyces sp. NPDC059398]|uniref:restriction endonuclease subunit S n=1 Tax=Streptomyces sp. NPDC059398 TaxID=3346820 RepID=UPI0036C8DBCA